MPVCGEDALFILPYFDMEDMYTLRYSTRAHVEKLGPLTFEHGGYMLWYSDKIHVFSSRQVER